MRCVGDDTRKDGWGLTVQIKLAMAEHARREASYRTRRALEGKARKGESAGGRAYGYISAKEAGGKRKVDPEHAKVVVQIYKWRALGWSGQRIARKLNADGVPRPAPAGTVRTPARTVRIRAVAGAPVPSSATRAVESAF